MDKIEKQELNETSGNIWVNEYDEVLNTMLKQIDCFQDNVAQIKDKYTEVIQENVRLSTQLKDLLFCETNYENSNNNHQDPLHSIANNLLQLMDLASKEKQVIIEFCQVIVEKMSHLEENLIGSQYNKQMDQSQKDLDDLRIEYSDVIRMLEAQLSSLRVMVLSEREKYELSVTHAERAEKEFQRARSEAAEAIAKGERAEKNEADMQRDVADLQMRQQELKDELQAALSREGAAQDRIEEALNLAEAALYEKDVAIMEQKISKEEVIQMKKTLDELVEDAGVRVKEEIEDVKKQFNLRIQEMIGEIMLKDKEIGKLREELEECTKKRRVMERRLERISEMQAKVTQVGCGSSEPGMSATHLFEQIAQLQVELAHERKENIDCKREKKLFEERLKTLVGLQDQQKIIESLKMELEASKINQAALLQVAEELREKVARLEADHSPEKFDRRGEENTTAEQRKIINIQENILKSIDLHNIMDAQLEMKQKWREEVSNLTHKFGKRIKELHDEVVKLRQEKKELQRRLRRK